jgi:hypothetical protein
MSVELMRGGGGSIWTLTRDEQKPRTPEEVTRFLVDELTDIRQSLRALVTLDEKLRAERSLGAERAFIYGGATITTTGFRLEDAVASVGTDVYTTLFCAFAAASGAGRYLYNGQVPATGGAVGSGLPIPAGFSTLTIVGRENIRNLRIVAEGATSVLLDFQLFR